MAEKTEHEPKRPGKSFTRRFVVVAVMGVVALCAFLVVVPLRYSQATDADLAGAMASRDGYVCQGGTFAGLTADD